MLVTIVADFQNNGKREADRYEAWTTSLLRLRETCKSGTTVSIEKLRDFLQYIPQQQRPDALQDLIAEHLYITWQQEDGVLLDAYCKEYGDEYKALSSLAKVPADLVEDEFLARFQSPHCKKITLEEYQTRFPERNDISSILAKRCLDKGRYIKINIIGRGAMGDVWKAYDCQANQLIALKQASCDSQLIGLDQESTTSSKLDHPNIVTLLKLPLQDKSSQPLFGMPLVEGQSLAQAIGKYHTPSELLDKKQRRLLMRQLLHSLADVCDAIDYAHSKDILHCDLKPGNILLNKEDIPFIIDWGMTKPITDKAEIPPSPASPQALIAGTPEYMAPEQAYALAEPRSDIFGLGSILYQILTSIPPHNWESSTPPADWLSRVKQCQVESPIAMERSTPPALNAICNKALSKDPDKRYQTASALAQDIRNYLSQQNVSVWNESLPAKFWRKLKGA